MKTVYHIKPRPAGDFAVQRWDAKGKTLKRWGVYSTLQKAQDCLVALRARGEEVEL